MLVSGLLFFFFFTKNIYSTNAWEMNESKANRQRWRAEGEGREQGGAGWTPQDRGPGLECSRRLTTADLSFLLSLEVSSSVACPPAGDAPSGLSPDQLAAATPEARGGGHWRSEKERKRVMAELIPSCSKTRGTTL